MSGCSGGPVSRGCPYEPQPDLAAGPTDRSPPKRSRGVLPDHCVRLPKGGGGSLPVPLWDAIGHRPHSVSGRESNTWAAPGGAQRPLPVLPPTVHFAHIGSAPPPLVIFDKQPADSQRAPLQLHKVTHWGNMFLSEVLKKV